MKKEKHQNHRGPRRWREKGVEGKCEQIIADNFSNLGKDTDIKSRKHRRLPQDSTTTTKKMTISKAYHSQIHKILRQGKNHEISKGKNSP